MLRLVERTDVRPAADLGTLSCRIEILVESGLGANGRQKLILAGREEHLEGIGGGHDLLDVNRIEEADPADPPTPPNAADIFALAAANCLSRSVSFIPKV